MLQLIQTKENYNTYTIQPVFHLLYPHKNENEGSPKIRT